MIKNVVTLPDLLWRHGFQVARLDSFTELHSTWIGGQERCGGSGRVHSKLTHPLQSAVQGETLQVREKIHWH